jgi:hypothetical protein
VLLHHVVDCERLPTMANPHLGQLLKKEHQQSSLCFAELLEVMGRVTKYVFAAESL